MARTIYFLALLFMMMPLFCTANDCDDDISVAFTLQSYQVLEGNGPAQPVLRLSHVVDCCSTISVWVQVEEIDATRDNTLGKADFNGKSYIQVLFPGGTTTAKFDVHIIDDIILERNETFRISIDPLSLPHGVVLGAVSSATVTILDDDYAVVSFHETTYTAEEKEGAVTVTLNLNNTVPFDDYSVELEITDGTTSSCDYESKMHIIPIPINTMSVDYTVVINADDLFEFEEKFTLEIKTSSHNKLKIGRPASTTITITKEDHPIHVTLTAQETIDETAGVLKVNLTLDKPSPCCLRVYVETVDKNATGDGVDHGEQNDGGQYEVIFPAGTDCSSIEFPISDDNLSEPDENFTVRIMKESLPFGIELGENTATDVTIIDNDIYLMFSSEDYEIYEHEGMVCVTVTHDKPALFDTFVQLIEGRGSADSGSDYEAGPYNVIIPKGERSAELCINIRNDEELEDDEAFVIKINENNLHPDVVLMDPVETTVTIMDDEYTLCFNGSTYIVTEDEGLLAMTLILSRPLPFDIPVEFLYTDLTATRGNQSSDEGIDYYTAITFPTIPANTTHYTLNVNVVPDRLLEDNELFQVTAKPPYMPADPQHDCSTQVGVIIQDDDDIRVNFESKSYGVRNKNKAENPPVIRITYPEGYIIPTMFPFGVEVIITNITANENEDFRKENYTFEVLEGMETEILDVYPVDDNIVEANEIYNLTITVLSLINRVISGENETTTITLYDDDVAFVSSDKRSSLSFTKVLQLPSNAVVNVLYRDGQYNNMTITPEEALIETEYELPRRGEIDKISLHFPAEFMRPDENVQPEKGFDGIIDVLYDL